MLVDLPLDGLRLPLARIRHLLTSLLLLPSDGLENREEDDDREEDQLLHD
jgi:hypothetical protein